MQVRYTFGHFNNGSRYIYLLHLCVLETKFNL